MLKYTPPEKDSDESSDEPKKKKAKKAKKDPNAPKKASTAYMQYCNETRKAVQEKNPGLKMTEVAKIIGSSWKDLTDDDKKPYQIMAAKDKERYERDQAKYDGKNK